MVNAACADQARSARLSADERHRNWLLPEGSTKRGNWVEIRTLDEILGKRVADGIKIDVEGAERLVLLGATVSLAERRIRAIQLEWNNLAERHYGESRDQLRELLAISGYSLFRPDDEGQLQPADRDTRIVGGGDVFALLDPSESVGPKKVFVGR